MFIAKTITGAALLCAAIAFSFAPASANAGQGFAPGGCYPPIHCKPHGCFPYVPKYCPPYGCSPYGGQFGGAPVHVQFKHQQPHHFQQNFNSFKKFNSGNFHR